MAKVIGNVDGVHPLIDVVPLLLKTASRPNSAAAITAEAEPQSVRMIRDRLQLLVRTQKQFLDCFRHSQAPSRNCSPGASHCTSTTHSMISRTARSIVNSTGRWLPARRRVPKPVASLNHPDSDHAA
jgi:hypothetical protein